MSQIVRLAVSNGGRKNHPMFECKVADEKDCEQVIKKYRPVYGTELILVLDLYSGVVVVSNKKWTDITLWEGRGILFGPFGPAGVEEVLAEIRRSGRVLYLQTHLITGDKYLIWREATQEERIEANLQLCH